MPDNLPKSLIGWVGLASVLLCLALAPVIGVIPAGPAYNGDAMLGVLRCLALIGAGCLLASPGKREATSQKPLGALLIAAGCGLTLLSFLVQSRVFTSPVLLFASLPGLLDWLCYGLLFLAASRLASGRALVLMVGALLAAAAIAAVASVQQYGGFVQEGLPQQRASGTFFSPNFAGGFMALLLPVVVAACLTVRQRLLPLVLGSLAALMVGALFASGSRAGVVFATVGCVVTVLAGLARIRSLPGFLPRLGGLIIVTLVLAFAFRGPLIQRVEAAGQEQSGPFRSYTWKGTIAMATAHPILGTGPGTFPYLYPAYSVVTRTDLAHSSYLQMAAEEGSPALVAIVLGLLMIIGSAVQGLFRAIRDPDSDPLRYLLAAGLLGGLLAGMARSAVDSEWSLLGNGFAFWTVAGLLSAIVSVPPPPAPGKTARRSVIDGIAASGALVGLVLALLCVRTAQQRQTVYSQLQRNQRSQEEAGWPPDSQTLYFMGRAAEGDKRFPDAVRLLEEVTRLEPTGKRYYQWASVKLAAGDTAGAIAALKESVEREPTSMQAWRRLAEIQETAQDSEGALASWRKLTELNEGLVGTVRAIPEATETHPAFGYFALARDAAHRGNISEAVTLYEKASRIVESYARTPALYQQVEVSTGTNVVARREEIRKLYEQIIQEWTGLQKERTQELKGRREETITLLDKMLAPSPSVP